MALTPTILKALEPSGSKRLKVYDSGGLFVHVQPTGSKTFRYTYRFSGKQRTLTFGRFPTVSLVKAREMRDIAKDCLERGIDPRSIFMPDEADREPATVPAERTFRRVADAWDQSRRGRLNDTHLDKVWGLFRKHVFPYLGTKDVAEITKADMVSVINRVEAAGTFETAKRTRVYCDGVFAYAIAIDLAERSPAEYRPLKAAIRPLPKKSEQTHQPKLEDTDIPEFFAKLAKWRGSDQTKLSLEFALHTGTRTTPFRLGKWDQIKGDVWFVPKENMKMRRDHAIPLTPRTIELLRALKRIAGDSEWFLPCWRTKTGIVHGNWMSNAMVKMGWKDRAVPHGFRRTFSTIANEHAGREHFHPDWIEFQIAHQDENAVRAIYNGADYLEDRRRMMNWWSNHLENRRAVSDILG